MKVRECMSLDICCCKPDETVTDVAKKMNEYHVGSMPVCDTNKNVVGIITDRDITLRCVACSKDVNSTPISEVMTEFCCQCLGQLLCMLLWMRYRRTRSNKINVRYAS